MPKALYSIEAISPNFFIKEGSKDAASPNVLGHIEIFCLLPLLNKANASLPCLGSELTLTGIPNPKDSDNS